MQIEQVGVERERPVEVVGEDGEVVHRAGGHGVSLCGTVVEAAVILRYGARRTVASVGAHRVLHGSSVKRES